MIGGAAGGIVVWLFGCVTIVWLVALVMVWLVVVCYPCLVGGTGRGIVNITFRLVALVMVVIIISLVVVVILV